MRYAYGCMCVGAAALVIACERSPVDLPCQPPQCVADLAVASVSVAGEERDTQTGLRVVRPGGVNVTVVVRNNGLGRSYAQLMTLDLDRTIARIDTVPRIEAGESWTASFKLSDAQLGAFLLDTDIMRVTATIAAVESNTADNTASSESFHLALPALKMSVALDSSRLRANAAVPSATTVENVSRHAGLPPLVFAFCLHDLGGRCANGFNGVGFGLREVPALAPAQIVQLVDPLTVPSTAAHQNRATMYMLGACVAEAGVVASAMPSKGTCVGVRDIEVRPDYEACAPVRLQPDEPAETTAICQQPCDIFVYSVDVTPGRSYRIETVDGRHDNTLAWRTRYRDNPRDMSSADGLQPQVAATVYLVTAPKYCGAVGPHRVVLRVD